MSNLDFSNTPWKCMNKNRRGGRKSNGDDDMYVHGLGRVRVAESGLLRTKMLLGLITMMRK